MLEKTKINDKEAGIGPFFKKRFAATSAPKAIGMTQACYIMKNHLYLFCLKRGLLNFGFNLNFVFLRSPEGFEL